MSKIIPFQFESNQVRVIADDNGEPLFVGKDLCLALGYTNHNDAMKQHCKGVAKRYPLATAGGTQKVRVLSEADMFRLVVNSKLPSAGAFERLVFEEILPTIRKTGRYVKAGSTETATRTHPSFAEKQLRRSRYLLSFDEDTGQSRLTEVAPNLCLVDPDSESSLYTLIGEFLPMSQIPGVLKMAAGRVNACYEATRRRAEQLAEREARSPEPSLCDLAVNNLRAKYSTGDYAKLARELGIHQSTAKLIIGRLASTA